MNLENEISALETHLRQMAGNIVTKRHLAQVLVTYAAKLAAEELSGVQDVKSFIERGLHMGTLMAEKLKGAKNVSRDPR